MPKLRKTLRVPLPRFVSGRLNWRRLVHTAALIARRDQGIRYHPAESLAVSVRLYLPPGKLRRVDVDNCLEHILDALQGRLAGEPKNLRRRKRIIPNDSQVYRVTIEKCQQSGKRTSGGGLLTVRPWRRASRKETPMLRTW